VVACLLTPGEDGQPSKELHSFGTMTADLLALSDWLAATGCSHVALESTGVFCKPIYNLLEDRFTVLVVKAAHIKAVPGCQTEVRAAE
jgi:transposase